MPEEQLVIICCIFLLGGQLSLFLDPHSEGHLMLKLALKFDFFFKFPSFAFNRLVAAGNIIFLHQNSHIWAAVLSPHACNFYMSTMSVSGSDDHIIPRLGPHIQVIIQQEWRIIQEDSALIYRQFCRDIGFGFSFFGKTLFIHSFIQPAIFQKHTSNWATMCCKTSILPPLPPATGHSLQPFPPTQNQNSSVLT